MNRIRGVLSVRNGSSLAEKLREATGEGVRRKAVERTNAVETDASVSGFLAIHGRRRLAGRTISRNVADAEEETERTAADRAGHGQSRGGAEKQDRHS